MLQGHTSVVAKRNNLVLEVPQHFHFILYPTALAWSMSVIDLQTTLR